MSNGALLKAKMLVAGSNMSIEQQTNGNLLLNCTASSGNTSVGEYRFTVGSSTTDVTILFSALGIENRPVFGTYFVTNNETNTYKMVIPNVDVLSDRFVFHMTGFTPGTYLLLYTLGVSIVRVQRDTVCTPVREDEDGVQCIWLDDANGSDYLQTYQYRYGVDKLRMLVKSAATGMSGNIALKIIVSGTLITTIAVPCSDEMQPFSITVPSFNGVLRLERDTTSTLDTLKDGDGLVITALIYDLITEGGF